jgi:uncharacterized protein YbjT (DUF2867 family)
MKIVIAGGHGQISMLMHPLLVERGHSVGGLIRNPTQEAAVRKAGAEPVICDLETEGDISDAVGEADAVIFAAGAGPGSGAARKTTMDRDGAIKLIEAARRNGVQRYIMISAMHAEEPRGDEVFRVYLQAKSEADKALRESGLDYTIVRPGRLTDDAGTGMIRAAAALPVGEIPRADVAGVVATVIETASTIGRQFDLTSGEQPIVEALASL